MKVGNPSDKATAAVSSTRAIGEGERQGQVRTEKSAPQPAASATRSSTVSLSPVAQQLTAEAGGADFDADKVAQVKSAMDQGTYKVNHQAIADKLIANAQELLGKTSN